MENVPKSHFELCVAGGCPALEHAQHLSITTLFGHISARSSIPKTKESCGGYATHFCRAKGFDFFRNLELFAATTQMLQRLRKPVARHGKLTGFCEWLVAVWPGEPIPCC